MGPSGPGGCVIPGVRVNVEKPEGQACVPRMAGTPVLAGLGRGQLCALEPQSTAEGGDVGGV